MVDTQWFKEKAREAGITTAKIASAISRDRAVVSRILNGHQKMTPEIAAIVSDLLKEPLNEVIKRAEMFPESAAPNQLYGFAESDAALWIPKDGKTQQDDTIADAFGARPGVDTWKVATNALNLMGIIPGDVILVDTHDIERIKAGDAVLAQSYDFQSGTAKTLLRRFEPPVLICASSDADLQRVTIVDNQNTKIMGKVIASWRT